MRKFSATALSLLIFASAAPAALCKHSDEEKGEDKKHQLVDEIIDAVQAEEKLSADELAEIKAKQKVRMTRVIDVISDKSQMSAEEKAKLKERLLDRMDQKDAEPKHDLPPELKERIEKKLDWKNFAHDTTYQVLADHFDDNDLKVILKFLKSKTGQKFFREAPDMVGQIVELSAEKYLPLIIELSRKFRPPHGMLKDLPPGLSPKDNNPEHRKEILEKWKQFMKEHSPNSSPSTPDSSPGKEEI